MAGGKWKLPAIAEGELVEEELIGCQVSDFPLSLLAVIDPATLE